MWRIFFKEVNSFLNSLIAYMVIAVFLTSLGLIVWVFPQSNVFDYGFADMYTFFSFAPYVLMFLIPAITMQNRLGIEQLARAGSLEAASSAGVPHAARNTTDLRRWVRHETTSIPANRPGTRHVFQSHFRCTGLFRHESGQRP